MWDQGLFCSPCKWIDLQGGQPNRTIQLQWSGDVPLTLWAASDYYDYDGFRVVTSQTGESALTVAVPTATTIVLVGVRSNSFAQQTVAQPVPFELTATAQ